MTYTELYEHRQRLNTEHLAWMKQAQADFEAVLVARWKAEHPRKRKVPDHRRLVNIYQDELDRARPLVTAECRRRSAEIAVIDAALITFASDEALVETDEWKTVRHVSESDYSTIGIGARGYAQRTAEMEVSRAQQYGVQARMLETSRARVYGYDIQVKLSDAHWHALKNLPVSVRDFLAQCWKRGINPRVLNPYLPAGLEERLGVTYFGELYDPSERVSHA